MKTSSFAALVVAAGVGASLTVGPGRASAAGADVTRVVVGSAGYDLFDALPRTPLVNRYLTHTADLGIGFYPGTPSVQVKYPWWFVIPGDIGRHISLAANRTVDIIKSTPGPIAVIGTSHGATNIDEAQRLLDTDPDAPDADQLTFIAMNDPERGIVTVFFPDNNFQVPLLGYIVHPPTESRYDTVVVAHEYDMWGDFPNRPWNLLAVVNSLMGALFVHQLAVGVPEGLAPRGVTVNSRGATTTTYFVPTQNLPLTEPLRILGIPDGWVDSLDSAVRPVIDAGYSRNDSPGDWRPYLDRGRFRTHTSTPTGTAAVSDASASTTVSVDPPAPAAPISLTPSPAERRINTTHGDPDPTVMELPAASIAITSPADEPTTERVTAPAATERRLNAPSQRASRLSPRVDSRAADVDADADAEQSAPNRRGSRR